MLSFKEYLQEAIKGSDLKKAREVIKVQSSGESVSPAYGNQIKAKAKELEKKYGSDWRKKVK